MPEDDHARRIAELEKNVALLESRILALKRSAERGVVQQALMDGRLQVLEHNRLFRLWDFIYRAAVWVSVRLNPGTRYGGRSDLRTPDDYTRWVSHEQHETEAERHTEEAATWHSKPLISVLIAVPADASDTACRDSLRSVFDQCYARWELCIAFEGAPATWLTEEIGLARAQERTHLCQCPAGASLINEAGSGAAGEFLLTLDPGDRLSPHALHYYVRALQADPAEMLYADEDHVDSGGRRTNPVFKPGWSPELLLSVMYVGWSAMYRRDLFIRHGGHRSEFGPAAPWDFALRMAEQNLRVCHIPRVLYHRSTTHGREDPQVDEGSRAALESALKRRALSGVVETSVQAGAYRVRYSAPPESRLSLIVCSKQVGRVRDCLESVRATSSIPCEILIVHHLESEDGEEMRRCAEGFGGRVIPWRGTFDFAKMNNLAAATATAPYLLLMNDDVIVKRAGWDETMAATLARPEIGIAGSILQYPDGTVQHAGIVMGMGDAVGHCGRFQMTSELWPWIRLGREVSAVTGAMLGVRADLFRRLGGFDERFPANYNDVDLCFRVRQAGLKIICLNLTEVIHMEGQTRRGGTTYDERDDLYEKWSDVLCQPDNFYSVHLAAVERIALNTEGVRKRSIGGLRYPDL